MGELEGFTSKHATEILKAFISERGSLPGTLRPNFQETFSPFNISCNCQYTLYLIRSHWDCRWWVLQSPREINVKWVKENRDTIWAAALLKYHAGEAHWFSGEEEQAAMALAEEYCAADPWQELLKEFLECLQNPELKPLQKQVGDMLFRSCHIISKIPNRKGPKYLTTNDLLDILLTEYYKKIKLSVPN